jgi:hypothetical protein
MLTILVSIMINVAFCKDTSGRSAVALSLATHAMYEDNEGNPKNGAALTPGEARALAYLLLFHAQQVENGASA